jgi:hypothetical protein
MARSEFPPNPSPTPGDCWAIDPVVCGRGFT